MSERQKHLFQFDADRIAAAANAEFTYHTGRADYWKGELDSSAHVVEATASIKVVRREITGGWTYQVIVDYGDPTAYARMQQAAHKIQIHQKAAERYASDGALYATQGIRNYQLDADDVAYFRLNERAREE